MISKIFAYITHKNGSSGDVAKELFYAAKKINSTANIIAIVSGKGKELDEVIKEISNIYDEIWKIDNSAFFYPNAEIIRKALVNLLPQNPFVITPYCTFGIDLSPGLSVKLNSVFIADVVDIDGIDGDILKIIRQEFGGMVSTHINCDIASGAVLGLRPGSFQTKQDFANGKGIIIDKSDSIGDFSSDRSFIEVIEAEAGDVDITKEDVLISIGRGIEDKDNIQIAEELAGSLGAVVSCSRPIVDAKWMDKSRQVGTSGQTVKPKIYIACGISGSFQHIGGIKGSPFIIAINKNLKAPIFQIANVGIEADILDFIPELTDAINNL